jgi:hypothetical protein
VAALCSFVAIPFWIFAASPWELAAGAFAMQFMVQGAWGVVPTQLTELSRRTCAACFRARGRNRLATPTRSRWSPPSCSSAAVVIALGRERAAMDFGAAEG